MANSEPIEDAPVVAELDIAGLSESDIVAQLRPYVNARAYAKQYGSQQTQIGELIKRWIQAHPGSVRDGEHGITAKLVDVTAPKEYDLWKLYNQERGLFETLIEAGFLKLDEPKLRRESRVEAKALDDWLLPQLVGQRIDVREDAE